LGAKYQNVLFLELEIRKASLERSGKEVAKKRANYREKYGFFEENGQETPFNFFPIIGFACVGFEVPPICGKVAKTTKQKSIIFVFTGFPSPAASPKAEPAAALLPLEVGSAERFQGGG